ncbi:MAG: hypothetical protein WAV74_14310 [Anaerolineae bacterium]
MSFLLHLGLIQRIERSVAAILSLYARCGNRSYRPCTGGNQRSTWLDQAHKRLDAAVLAAYGWPAGLTDDDILARLLALNLARAARGNNDAHD